MPAGSKPGEHRGGRKPGTPNKPTQLLRERLAAIGCDYVGFLALTVKNEVPCGVCRGTGRTKFKSTSGKPAVRECQSCWGDKLERLDPKLRVQAAATLMEYCEAKRKAVEVTGDEGGPVEMVIRWEGE